MVENRINERIDMKSKAIIFGGLVIGLLARRAGAVMLGVVSAGVVLAMSKVYGFPILNSMNLWGGLVLTVSLIVGLMTGRLSPQSPHKPVKRAAER